MKTEHIESIKGQVAAILRENNIIGTAAEQQITDVINAALSSRDVVNSRDEDARDKQIASLQDEVETLKKSAGTSSKSDLDEKDKEIADLKKQLRAAKKEAKQASEAEGDEKSSSAE